MGWGGGQAWGAKCAHPDCNYMRHSDPSISKLYCCEKCEGLHKGEEWAEGGKRHYKSCEKIEVSSGGGGGWGGFGSGGGGDWGGFDENNEEAMAWAMLSSML